MHAATHHTLHHIVQEPQEVLVPEPVQQVAAGDAHTLCLTAAGSVWAMGSNKHGQLGLGSIDPHSSKPRLIKALHGVPLALPLSGTCRQRWPLTLCCVHAGQRIKAVAAGASHSMALAEDGAVYTWGCGTQVRKTAL